MPSPCLITDDLLAFLGGGRRLTLASRDAFLTPALAPALACRVAPDRNSLTILLARQHAGRLLADIATNGMVSLLCTQPGHAQALQIKGKDARELAVTPDDQRLVESQREAMAADLLPLGFGTRYSYTLSDSGGDSLVALCFTASELLRPMAGVNPPARQLA